MNDFVSVTEAIGLTGKSVSSIRRVIKRVSGTNAVKKDGERYLIKKDVLLKELGIQAATNEDTQTGTQLNTPLDTHDYLLEILKEQLERQSQQLQKKDEQIAQKDDQITKLIERLRETNILMSTSQQRQLTVQIPEKTASEK